MKRKWGISLLLLLAIAPAILPLVLIARYGVGFANWDEWDPGIAGLYLKLHQHQFHVGDLFAFHNEHRIALPRLVFIIVNSLSHWNTIPLMLVSWLMVAITSVMMLRLIGKTVAETDRWEEMLRPRVLMLWFVANVLIFTPAQWENWLWGMGVQNFMPMMWISGGLLLAYRPTVNAWQVAVITLLAILATYSSGNGLLAWPMLGGMLAWSASWQELKAKKWRLAAFAAVGFIVLISYFWGFREKSAAAPQPHTSNPIAIAKYIGIFLGVLLCNGTTFSAYTAAYSVSSIMLLMLIGVLGYLVWLWRNFGDADVRRRIALWLIVASYGLLSATLAGMARAGSGHIQAFSSRYVTFSLYVAVSLIPLLAIISDDIGKRVGSIRSRIFLTRASSVLVSCMLVMSVLAIPQHLQAAKDVQYARRQGKAAILFSRLFPDNPWIDRVVFPRPAEILPMLDQFEQMGWIDPRFTTSDARTMIELPDQPLGAKGHLEGTYQVDEKSLGTQGWAVLLDRPSVSDGVVLTYDNEAGQPILFAYAGDRIFRADVAKSLNNVDLHYAGWEAVYPTSALPTSLKTVRIRAWAVDAELRRIAPLEGIWSINR